MKKNRWFLVGAGLLLVLVVVVGLVWFNWRSRSSEIEDEQVFLPPEEVNTIPIEQRPFVTLTPSQQGRNLTITLHDIKKPADEAEIELEYQSGSLLQVAMGIFKLQKLPERTDILLGSCSAGGKCSYDEDVEGGSLLLRFLGEEKYVLKNDWAFIDNTNQESLFSSRDGKFSLESTGLARIKYGVILQSPGLPEELAYELLSAPYAPSVEGTTTSINQVEVAIRLNANSSTASIFGWDGEQWVELETEVAEKVATAQGPWYLAYVAAETESVVNSAGGGTEE